MGIYLAGRMRPGFSKYCEFFNRLSKKGPPAFPAAILRFQVLHQGQRTFRRGRTMSDHIYKIIQLVGSSPTSVEDAVQNAVERASKKLKHLRWFEVLETRGHIENGKVSHYQVTLKVGFTLDDTIDASD
jgi:hypothetical protein